MLFLFFLYAAIMCDVYCPHLLSTGMVFSRSLIFPLHLLHDYHKYFPYNWLHEINEMVGSGLNCQVWSYNKFQHIPDFTAHAQKSCKPPHHSTIHFDQAWKCSNHMEEISSLCRCHLQKISEESTMCRDAPLGVISTSSKKLSCGNCPSQILCNDQ
jgi:hypothetical protein